MRGASAEGIGSMTESSRSSDVGSVSPSGLGTAVAEVGGTLCGVVDTTVGMSGSRAGTAVGSGAPHPTIRNTKMVGGKGNTLLWWIRLK